MVAHYCGYRAFHWEPKSNWVTDKRRQLKFSGARKQEVTPGAGRDSCLLCEGRRIRSDALNEICGMINDSVCECVRAKQTIEHNGNIAYAKYNAQCKLGTIRSEQDERRGSAWKRHSSNSSLTFVWCGHAKYLIFAMTQKNIVTSQMNWQRRAQKEWMGCNRNHFNKWRIE